MTPAGGPYGPPTPQIRGSAPTPQGASGPLTRRIGQCEPQWLCVDPGCVGLVVYLYSWSASKADQDSKSVFPLKSPTEPVLGTGDSRKVVLSERVIRPVFSKFGFLDSGEARQSSPTGVDSSAQDWRRDDAQRRHDSKNPIEEHTSGRCVHTPTLPHAPRRLRQ